MWGRIGRVRTKSGVLETPALLPVVHPLRQTIPAGEMKRMGFQGVMTNAYLAWKHRRSEAESEGIHRLIGFDGVVMTDSGGYQVLEYGDVEVKPLEIARFQEHIGSDIGIMLDRPTGFDVSRRYAQMTVRETLRAGRETMGEARSRETLWTGAIQGGKYLDLVESSAKRLTKLGFDLFALGSPTEVMESYHFRLLAEMIVAAKKNIPLCKPLHLFGAGHPLTIPLAVALGCDLFDSASYMLYARSSRYMTNGGTLRLESMRTLPCSCPICSNHTVKDLVDMQPREREACLARHNLYVLQQEVKAVKQALVDGRLWEYMGAKARTHPSLWDAFAYLAEISDLLEDGTPLFKSKAAYFFTPLDQRMPEALRHHGRLVDDIEFSGRKTLLMLTELESKPFSTAKMYRSLAKALKSRAMDVQVCVISPALGVIPIELSEVYPLSQYLYPLELAASDEADRQTASKVKEFVDRHGFERIFLACVSLEDKRIARAVKRRLRNAVYLDLSRKASMRDKVKTLVSALNPSDLGS